MSQTETKSPMLDRLSHPGFPIKAHSNSESLDWQKLLLLLGFYKTYIDLELIKLASVIKVKGFKEGSGHIPVLKLFPVKASVTFLIFKAISHLLMGGVLISICGKYCHKILLYVQNIS